MVMSMAEWCKPQFFHSLDTASKQQLCLGRSWRSEADSGKAKTQT
jgi:hypothetical protein